MSETKASDLEEHSRSKADWKSTRNGCISYDGDDETDLPSEETAVILMENVTGVFSPEKASRPSTPVSSCLHSPNLLHVETSVLNHLDLSGGMEAQMSVLPLHLAYPRFLAIQDISEMETPFLAVSPPESPGEVPLMPRLQLLTGLPANPALQDLTDGGGIHSCVSSASCLASAMSTPLAIKKIKSSDSDTGTDLLPVCRICQLPGDKEEFLFSPCRCSGTMMYVHYVCLLKWIEISTRKTNRPPRCELCHFQYVRHKRFKFRRWRMPHVSQRDKFLHTVFIISLLIMLGCAVATILCFLSDKRQLEELPRGHRPADRNKQIDLTSVEIITLICGIMFFVSFFMAMTVEIKAKHTIYRLFLRFLSHNTEWQIESYQRAKDQELLDTKLPSYV